MGNIPNFPASIMSGLMSPGAEKLRVKNGKTIKALTSDFNKIYLTIFQTTTSQNYSVFVKYVLKSKITIKTKNPKESLLNSK